MVPGLVLTGVSYIGFFLEWQAWSRDRRALPEILEILGWEILRDSPNIFLVTPVFRFRRHQY